MDKLMDGVWGEVWRKQFPTHPQQVTAPLSDPYFSMEGADYTANGNHITISHDNLCSVCAKIWVFDEWEGHILEKAG